MGEERVAQGRLSKSQRGDLAEGLGIAHICNASFAAEEHRGRPKGVSLDGGKDRLGHHLGEHLLQLRVLGAG